MADFTLGHDAEVFVRDIETKKIVPVFGMIGGTKSDPLPVKQGALQEDNVMAELNIYPAKTAQEFINNTKIVMEELRQKLLPYGNEPHIAPVWDNVNNHALNTAMMEAFGRIIPEDEQFGCEPDYCAWKLVENDPINLVGESFRFCGGHIHIGVPFSEDQWKVVRLVRLLDLTLLTGLRILFGTNKRDPHYGMPGRHRPKEYGVEYRSPSNQWLLYENVQEWIHKVVSVCVNRVEAGEEGEEVQHDNPLLLKKLRLYPSRVYSEMLPGIPLPTIE